LNALGLAANLRAAISVVPGLAPVAAGEVGGFWNEDMEPTFAAGGLCLSCHTTAQTKNTTGQKSDGTTATVALVKADFQASAHGYAGPVGSFTNDASGKTFGTVCVKCHNSDATPDYQNGTYQFQLHTSADRRLRAPMGGTPGDNAEEKFCFRCHSQTVDPIGGATKSAVGLDYYGVATMWGPAEGVYQAFTGQPALPTSTTNAVYFKPTAQENPSAPMPGGPITDTGTTFATNALFLRDAGATAPVEPMPNVYQLASGTYDTTTLRLRPMTPQMGATTETVTVNTVNAAGVTYERMAQFVSPPIAVSFTWNTGATLTLAMRAIESNANNNCNLRFRVYRWAVADTGTALTAITDGAEIPAALVTDGSTFNANTTTAVTFAVGDKIVIEIESRKNSPRIRAPARTHGAAGPRTPG